MLIKVPQADLDCLFKLSMRPSAASASKHIITTARLVRYSTKKRMSLANWGLTTAVFVVGIHLSYHFSYIVL